MGTSARSIEELRAIVGALDPVLLAAEHDVDRTLIEIALERSPGPLDLLGQLDDLGYEDLLPRSIVVEDGSLSLRVLDLPTLIEVKTRAGRPKDKIALPLLLATLVERQRRGDG